MAFPTNTEVYKATHREVIWERTPVGELIPYSNSAELTEIEFCRLGRVKRNSYTVPGQSPGTRKSFVAKKDYKHRRSFMGTKKVKYNETEINKLPNNKPVIYKIKTANGNNNYTGVAQRGRVQQRINEHIGTIPGATVQIEQMNSISEARKKEANIIKRSKPKYNKQGK